MQLLNKSIKGEYNELIIGVVMNGENVKLGINSGVAVQLQQNYHLLMSFHCVAYRAQLCANDTFNNEELINNIDNMF